MAGGIASMKSNQPILAHLREDLTNVPVTPAFGDDARSSQFDAKPRCKSRTVEGYFGPRNSLHDLTKAASEAAQPLPHGNLISATFAIPYILEIKKSAKWQLDRRFYRSVHLDCLSHLSSSEGAVSHTVIAWTGEISRPEEGSDGVSTASSSTTIAPDGHTHGSDFSDKAVFISSEEQSSLEKELYNCNERIVPVWLFDDAERRDDGIILKNQSTWRKYAEHDLFPLFHYKQRGPTSNGQEDVRWKKYYKANAAFADTICATYKPGDIVLVHDYYLALVPKMVRQRLPDVRIAFILQTPFATSELVRCLHRRKELLEGILGADLVVFQARCYAQHFANSCARILKVTANEEQVDVIGRRVQLMNLPTGVKIEKITGRTFTPSVDQKCAELAHSFAGKKIILGHDPMHSLSGIHMKLQGYERFLRDNPEWREKVALVQMTSQAMLEVDGNEESEFSAKVSVLASSINSKYGSLNHTPVHLSPLPPNEDEYFALLRHSDMALITSVREGISTTALEYVICQRDKQGMLILSEFSGTAMALDKAILVNPWDVSAVARQIHVALTMPCDQRRCRHSAVFQQVRKMDVGDWASTLLRRMEAVTRHHGRKSRQHVACYEY